MGFGDAELEYDVTFGNERCPNGEGWHIHAGQSKRA